ncbi:hypothetical protein [Sphingomonas sp. BAUL-RG-20F-R05-02]|uniref:hypothetical protein n=1 Tax=Sphingomonas sp. BAUL-RG-20F-R05-02 TaxID=2914830 RepID=UPI001F58E3E5|nr:hypothetical protein [Sphingomonas sp. BAUL-RG-20F-R05-02]
MIDVLSLGDGSLDYERFLIVAELEDRIRDGTIDPANVTEEIALWSAIDAYGKRKAFGHVAVRYLGDEPL